SRTNSPACVDGALPCRLSRFTRAIVPFSGICPPRDEQCERNGYATRIGTSRALRVPKDREKDSASRSPCQLANAVQPNRNRTDHGHLWMARWFLSLRFSSENACSSRAAESASSGAG